MTSARRTQTAQNLLPLGTESWLSPGRLAASLPVDGANDLAWPTGLRAMLLLTGAVHPADATLARTHNQELAMLRAALQLLYSSERTSAA